MQVRLIGLLYKDSQFLRSGHSHRFAANSQSPECNLTELTCHRRWRDKGIYARTAEISHEDGGANGIGLAQETQLCLEKMALWHGKDTIGGPETWKHMGGMEDVERNGVA